MSLATRDVKGGLAASVANVDTENMDVRVFTSNRGRQECH
jgi:hypothetical protein